MSNTASKRGRKRKPHNCSWDGKPVHGLYHQPDGRWRVVETGYRYSEPDEREAVKRFYELTQPKQRTVTLEHDLAEALQAISDRTEKQVTSGQEVDGPMPAILRGLSGVSVGDGKVVGQQEIDELAYIARVRRDILERSEWLARVTGIEWLAWHDHQKPVKADTLADMGEAYLKHSKLSANELSRSKCHWAEFCKVAKGMDITTVDGVNHELAHKYEAYIEGQGLAPKTKLHRYRKIRGILHFAIKRGMSVDACRKALDVTAFWEVKDAHPLDPTPISPKDFWAIYGEAIKAGDKGFAALLLTSLNAALYGGEVAAVRWDEIDFATGGFVSRRSKTGVSRIGMAWPETLTAIQPLEHLRDEVFCTKVRSYTVFSVGDKFEKYRDAAKVGKEVTFSWIRDAAYSIALGRSSFAEAEMLAGHRLPGTADNYLRRNPQLVAKACQAIREAFEVEKHLKV